MEDQREIIVKLVDKVVVNLEARALPAIRRRLDVFLFREINAW